MDVKRQPAQRGSALIVACLILLVVIPLIITLTNTTKTSLRSAFYSRQYKTARMLANDAMVDFMRQFSQSAYDVHYSSAVLARPVMFYNVGFSSVTVIPNALAHTLFLQASGRSGPSATGPLARKTLYAVIQFVSDLTTHSTLVNTNFTSGAGAVYNGRVRINGNWACVDPVTVNGGPVVVTGSITAGNPVINGDLYCPGTIGGTTVTGTWYRFAPDFTWPSLDLTYYSQRYNYLTTTNATITFNPTGTFTVIGTTTPITIPATGAIIFARNANLTIHGTVLGRVTIVAGGPAGSPTQGNITIDSDLLYSSGSDSADATHSIAVLASNWINFAKDNSGLTVHGVFFSDNASLRATGIGLSGRTLNVYGTRIINQQTQLSAYSTRSYIFDTQLQRYPPPGLPENPLLATWHMVP